MFDLFGALFSIFLRDVVCSDQISENDEIFTTLAKRDSSVCTRKGLTLANGSKAIGDGIAIVNKSFERANAVGCNRTRHLIGKVWSMI